MKVLVLTDHLGHSVHNSLYNLINEIFARPEVNQVSIASRGDERNMSFFSGKSNEIYAFQLDEFVSYPMDTKITRHSKKIELDTFDIVFLRLPRPLNTLFFPHLISIFPENQVINKPSGIQLTSNKSFLTRLDNYTVPMALCNDFEDIEEFHSEYDCVLKPLEDYGGRGIIKITNNEVFIDGATHTLRQFQKIYNDSPQPYLAMKYLNNVKNGDKRIVVVNGIILTSSLRLPAEGNWLCNVAQGGKDVPAEPTEREKEIVNYLNPILINEGIFYYGLDTLEDDNGLRVISEVNTLSIGGIAPAELNSHNKLSKIFAEQFVQYANKKIKC